MLLTNTRDGLRQRSGSSSFSGISSTRPVQRGPLAVFRANASPVVGERISGRLREAIAAA